MRDNVADKLRNKDAKAIDDCVPLLRCTANFVDPSAHPSGSKARFDRVDFTLRRFARQVPEIWAEFLFGSTLSTKGDR